MPITPFPENTMAKNWYAPSLEESENQILKLENKILKLKSKQIIIKTSILINPKKNVNRPNYPYRVEISTLF